MKETASAFISADSNSKLLKMNSTYCFNNNIPNHYQTGNSLSTEWKGSCFHYDLLLKKAIFKSSIFPIFPMIQVYLGRGTMRSWQDEHAPLFHPKWIYQVFRHSCQLLCYLLIITIILFCIQFWHAMVHTNVFVHFWNIRTVQRRITVIQMWNIRSGDKLRVRNCVLTLTKC